MGPSHSSAQGKSWGTIVALLPVRYHVYTTPNCPNQERPRNIAIFYSPRDVAHEGDLPALEHAPQAPSGVQLPGAVDHARILGLGSSSDLFGVRSESTTASEDRNKDAKVSPPREADGRRAIKYQNKATSANRTRHDSELDAIYRSLPERKQQLVVETPPFGHEHPNREKKTPDARMHPYHTRWAKTVDRIVPPPPESVGGT